MRVSRFLVAMAIVACGKPDVPDPETDQRPSAMQRDGDASESEASRVAFEVVDETGEPWGRAEPRSDGYGYGLRATDGSKTGKIQVRPDRVKVKGADGATRATVKAKDYGFKVYEGEDRNVAKAKRKGAGYKLSREDGSALGEINTKGPGGQVGGATITVQTESDRVVVTRDGAVAGSVSSSIRPEAVAFLAVTELGFAERVAAMVYVQEHER